MVADLDGDGADDLIAGAEESDFRMMFRLGTPMESVVQMYYQDPLEGGFSFSGTTALTVGDIVAGDGRLEIIIGNDGGGGNNDFRVYRFKNPFRE